MFTPRVAGWFALRGVALVGALMFASCGDSSSSGRPPSLVASPSSAGNQASYQLTAGSQKLQGQDLIVTHVVMHKAGWVAAHADVNGAPGVVVGVSDLLSAGSHDNVALHLYRSQSSGTKVMTVVHLQDTSSSTFDYPKHDAPAIVDGQVVVLTLQLQ